MDLDKEIVQILKNTPKLKQRQYSIKEQLNYARMFANRLGLYDAADAINFVGSYLLKKGE